MRDLIVKNMEKYIKEIKMKKEKENLRTKMIKKLSTMPPHKEIISGKIINDLTELEIFKNAKKVSVYVSNVCEVDTSELLKIDKVFETKINNGELVLDEGTDLLIVPGVAFDHERNRVGDGTGVYDKLLENNDVYTIGVCFLEQVVEKLPVGKHDKKVNLVVFG